MDLEPMSIRGHTVVAVPATRANTRAIITLAIDLGKPPSACAFCPGFQSHRCRWFKPFGNNQGTYCEGTVRYVSTEIWPIVQLRLP